VRIHAIQTGTVAVRERQRHGQGRDATRLLNTLLDRAWTESLPIHAWLVEHDEGLIVVDTGETARAGQRGYFPAWHPYFRLGVRTWVEPEQEIGPQLQRLGFSPRDVRWVILTHLHTDHAGGLHHFPDSEILVTRTELELASGPTGRLRGYLPHRWPDWFQPTLVDFADEPFGSFSTSQPLTDAGDITLLPTPGHTAGHMSVAVPTDDRLVLLAGDTSYTQSLMVQGIADGVTNDAATARDTLQRLQRLTQAQPTVYLPSHDPDAARRLREREPAQAEPTPITHG
jgi:glyoxylase-like metal-dependent hydrolase (beta-lactamase superfamily II)